ncbi:MAG TPA: hypothetical protein VKR24_10610 [Candidatus Limnocylindrales bacterium]|nr:hypothetical protein [Candidatus Limnocylindrales bacterium]
MRVALAAVALTTGIIAGSGAPVGAWSEAAMCTAQWTAFAAKPSISTARTVGHCEIDRRLIDLSSLSTAAADDATLTSADRSTISHTISRSRSGLKSLDSKLAHDSTISTLGPDLDAITNDYRVYVLVIRQSWQAGAADGELAAVKALGTADGKLGAAIDVAKAAGYDTSAAETARAALEADTSSAAALIHGLASKVLALTPAQYDAGTAGPIMDDAGQSLASAYDSLVAARAQAQSAVDALQALAGH